MDTIMKTENQTINVLELSPEFPVIMRTEAETAAHRSYTLFSGYGRAAQAYVTVQKGAKAELQVDFTVNAISAQSFNEWKSIAKTFFSENQWREIEEKSKGAGGSAGFLTGCFGIGIKGNYNEYHGKTTNETVTNLTSEQEGFLKSVYNLRSETLKVTGKIVVEGVSFIPVTCSVVLLLSQVRFQDDKFINVINTTDSALVVDEQGQKTDEAKVNEMSVNMGSVSG